MKSSAVISIEIEDILPKGQIPLNDSFTFTIKHGEKKITELFPVTSILSFKVFNLSETKVFEVSIAKGPLGIFQGNFEISKLVFLNKETVIKQSFALVPKEGNKKLIRSLSGSSTIKIQIIISVLYNAKKIKDTDNLIDALSAREDISIRQKENGKYKRPTGDLEKAPKSKLPCAIVTKDGILDETTEMDEMLKDNFNDITEEKREIFMTSLESLNLAITNFVNNPCKRYSVDISEKFFKLHDKYKDLTKDQNDAYYKLKKTLETYTEKFQHYSKLLSKTNKMIKDSDEQQQFFKLISAREKKHVADFADLAKKECHALAEIFGMNIEPLREQKSEFKNNFKNKKSNNENDKQKLIDILEVLSKRPEALINIQEDKLKELTELSRRVGVKIEIPREWKIDKIEEEPEISISEHY